MTTNSAYRQALESAFDMLSTTNGLGELPEQRLGARPTAEVRRGLKGPVTLFEQRDLNRAEARAYGNAVADLLIQPDQGPVWGTLNRSRRLA